MSEGRASFWGTFPGILTAIAMLITALAGLLTWLYPKEPGTQQEVAPRVQSEAPRSDVAPERAIAEHQDQHPVLTREFLTTSDWTFLHGQGDIISPNVRLDPSGRIVGIDHPNEARWGLEDNILVFYHQDGQPSTRFTEMSREGGKITLSGRLLLTDETVYHVLKEH